MNWEVILFIIIIVERVIRSIIDFRQEGKKTIKMDEIHTEIKNGK